MDELRAEVDGLRAALAEFADPTSWWQAEATNAWGTPITVRAWRFGDEPWTRAQQALDDPTSVLRAEQASDVIEPETADVEEAQENRLWLQNSPRSVTIESR